MFPILYCLIDGLGTFADAVYLDELSLITEDDALLAYEFTFLICAVISFIYLKIKKVKFTCSKKRIRALRLFLKPQDSSFMYSQWLKMQ